MSSHSNPHTRLRMARIAAGFKSAKAFCAQYNIPASTYSLHETGGRSLKQATTQKYAELLNVSAEWLLTGTGHAYEDNDKINSHPISDAEFKQLLNYKGKEIAKTTNNTQNQQTTLVDATLFAKILLKLQHCCQHNQLPLTEQALTQTACELYADITQSSQDSAKQMIMIDLAITTFLRQTTQKTQTTKAMNE